MNAGSENAGKTLQLAGQDNDELNRRAGHYRTLPIATLCLLIPMHTVLISLQFQASSGEKYNTRGVVGYLRDLVELRCRTTRYGKRSSPASALLIWNSLPTTVCDVSTSMTSFSGRLKAELFRSAYGTDLAPM